MPLPVFWRNSKKSKSMPLRCNLKIPGDSSRLIIISPLRLKIREPAVALYKRSFPSLYLIWAARLEKKTSSPGETQQRSIRRRSAGAETRSLLVSSTIAMQVLGENGFTTSHDCADRHVLLFQGSVGFISWNSNSSDLLYRRVLCSFSTEPVLVTFGHLAIYPS